MGFKKYDGSTWQPITPKKLKGIPYTGTLPATFTGTKAGYLHGYKIYGNLTQNGTPTPSDPIVPSECGERTENRFDISLVERGGWNASVGTIPAKNDLTTRTRYNQIIPLLATTLSLYCPSNVKINYVWIDANGYSLGGSGWQKNGDTATAPEQTVSMTFILGLDNDINCTPSDFYDINLVAGSTAPTSYIPYGYKLPLTSGNTPVDIYIGDDTLSTEEYVDSGTGKVYHMVDGVLTPTDPPMPFPEIPTSANSTTISWAGSGLAPSQFDSIQEWVDIPTYTRVNGEWVAE
jgi:hypothetical protein